MDTPLPTPLTSFVGRAGEIAEIVLLLQEVRSVTLTGPGGTGKTRLALEVARRISGTEALDVHWIELAPLETPGLLTQHVAAQLSVRERPELSVLDAVAATLGQGCHVLVLDNCEHLVEESATLVAQLLRRCAGLRVLATSREALGVDGEHAWLVPGLAVGGPEPSPDRGEMQDAVLLFAERARAVSASFEITPANLETIRRICRRLDGLPLAIELAAARVPVLGPEEISRRLDDALRVLSSGSRTALPRHRTLRAAVDWSHRLLSPPEQLLLDRLSVFAGSFTLRAVEAVCAGDDLPDEEILDTLASLVTRSLVVMRETEGSARYQLLEIVRQYARERIVADAEALHALSRRHAEFYADLAERALPDLERHHSADWAALPQELDNLRAAMHWAFGDGEDRIGHRLTGALWWYWGRSGQWSEGSMWLGEAVCRADPSEGPAWGQVLNGAGTWAYLEGDIDRAKRLLVDAAQVLGRGGDRVHQVMAMSTLAHLHSSLGEVDEAVRRGQAAVDIARDLEESWPRAHALVSGLGRAHGLRGEHDLADACHAEAFEAASRDGHHWGMAEAARARAQTSLDRKDVTGAAAHLRVGIASGLEIDDPFQMARLLALSAVALAEAGDHVAAARLYGTLEAQRGSGVLMLPDDIALYRRGRDAADEALGEPSGAAEAEAGAGWSLAEALRNTRERLAALRGVAPVDDGLLPWSEPVPHPSPVVATPSTPGTPLLKVRALGGVEASIQGVPLSAEAWSHARPRELLVFLLCHPGGRTKEEVGLAFWPDATSAQVKNSFHVLMHRLRKALGSGEIIRYEGERYRVDPDGEVWFDVSVFEAEIAAVLRGRGTAADLPRLHAALALYRGAFMEGEVVGDWALEVQDRMGRLYCDGLERLANLQLDAGDVAEAVDSLERLLAREDLREDVARLLMTCLVRIGRRDRALLHYRRIVARLRDELDSDPEPETEELARRLESGAQV